MALKTKEQRREERVARVMMECRHFTGIQHPACTAEVSYSSFLGGIPCLPFNGCYENECEKRSTSTRPEAEAIVAEREAAAERWLKAHEAAHVHAKAAGLGKGHGGTGALPCPACGSGELRYAVAGYNGHMHARCSTAGCVAWME